MKKLVTLSLLALSLFIVGCTKKTDDSKYQAVADSIQTIDMASFDELRKKYHGNVLVINFFATWCPPCREEMPDFVNAYNNHKDNGLVIVALSTDANYVDIAKFMEEYNVTFPVYYADEVLQNNYGIQKIPTSIIFDANGELFQIAEGMLSEEYLNKLVKLKGQ